MNTSDAIAVIALAISALSAWISYMAYLHSVRAKEEGLRLTFSRQKSEFLVRIEKARKTFDALEERLKRQLTKIEAAPEEACVALATHVSALVSDLKYVERCQKQAWSLWDETYEMNQSGFAHHGPRFLGLIEDDEKFACEANSRCNSVERRMSAQRSAPTTDPA
jgi:hypothetical protein